MPVPDDVHQDHLVLDDGAPLEEAQAAMILLHGRGASARGMLSMIDDVDAPGVAYLAPQAARRSWYPQSFMSPIEENEPALGSALQVVGDLVERVCTSHLTEEQVVLLGFSQGACLVTEYAARHPQRYGGVVGLSGGLMGPEGTDLGGEGTLAGTPVFLGCSDQDPYIPIDRVEATAEALRHLSARVTLRVYEGATHTVNEDELDHVRELLGQHVDLTASSPSPTEADENEDSGGLPSGTG